MNKAHELSNSRIATMVGVWESTVEFWTKQKPDLFEVIRQYCQKVIAKITSPRTPKVIAT